MINQMNQMTTGNVSDKANETTAQFCCDSCDMPVFSKVYLVKATCCDEIEMLLHDLRTGKDNEAGESVLHWLQNNGLCILCLSEIFRDLMLVCAQIDANGEHEGLIMAQQGFADFAQFSQWRFATRNQENTRDH